MNKYETNIAILKEALSGQVGRVDELIICSGNDYADALSASATRTPILLVGNTLTDEQIAYIESMAPKNVIILGSEDVVPKVIEAKIRTIGNIGITTERILGSDRYETSVRIAERFFGNCSETAVLTYGLNFADGISAGPLALAFGCPVILATSNSTLFAENYARVVNINKAICLGGKSLISDEAVQRIIGKIR
jgi:putative cell wall-binding protein